MDKPSKFWSRVKRMTLEQALTAVPRKTKNVFTHFTQRASLLPQDVKRCLSKTEGGTPDLEQILMCPFCRGALRINKAVTCVSCDTKFQVRSDVIIITEKPGDYIKKNSLAFKRTNPYSNAALEIIEENREGRVLDFGAGFPPENNIFDHVIRLDITHYPMTTVVVNTRTVPFQDDTFDAIISESVLEHLPDPFHFAREAYRLLKPGGVIRVDTAFLQPYHDDPDHYFNMSISGLRQVFSNFEEIETGVAEYQRASFAVTLILQAYARCVPGGEVREQINRLLAMPLHDLDADIGPLFHQALAAGVFFHGQKK